MIETRLLDPGNKSDFFQLRDILNHYLEDSRTRPNQVWSESAALATIARVLMNFNIEFKNHIFIGGTFVDGVLEKIYIGEKFAMYFEKHSEPYWWPCWFPSMMYSKDKKIKNTHKELYDISTLVAREMEKQKYYTFYTIMKCPIKNNKNFFKQIENNFPFSVMARYHNCIEEIIDPLNNVEGIGNHFYKHFFPESARNKNTNHRLLLASHHLKNEYRDFSKELGIQNGMDSRS
jgi:hypothetical protein